MTVAIYADECVHGALVRGLRAQGVDVRTIQEDRALGTEDRILLRRATAQGRVLLTHDDDFCAIRDAFLRNGTEFAGVLYCRPQRLPLGRLIEEIATLALAGEPEDFRNRLLFLPS